MCEKQFNPLSDVDLKPLSDLGIHAMNKLEKLFGFCFDRYGTKRIAVNSLVKSVESSNLPEHEKAIIIYNADEIIKQISRQKSIIKSALNHIVDNNLKIPDNDEGLDEEWYSRFFDNAKHICNKEMQILWGRILAGELTNPGSVPKRLLHIMSVIEREQAMTFYKLCSYSVRISGTPYLIYNHSKNSEFSNHPSISYTDIKELETIGLISYDNDQIEFKLSFPVEIVGIVAVGGVCIELSKPKDAVKSIPLGNVCLTKSGIALYNAIEIAVIDNSDYFIDYFKSFGFSVKIL